MTIAVLVAALVRPSGEAPSSEPPVVVEDEIRAPSAEAPSPSVATARAAASRLPATLPASALRGPIDRLHQYPTLSAATVSERAAARRLLREIVSATNRWPTLADAEGAGYDTRTARRRPGDTSVHYFHAEHASFEKGHSYLDPTEPKALIYANPPPPWPLRLVGVMFSVPRGARGETPGGPITRWHTHTVCARPGERGLAPRRNGTCPTGAVRRQGSEMMHVWLTGDLRSAFSTHAPTEELGVAGLLPELLCRLDPPRARRGGDVR